MRPIPIGATGIYTQRVVPSDLANQFKDITLPPVFATPMMGLRRSASVKPTADFSAERGGGFVNGGRFVMTNVDVRTLVRIAYRSGPVLFPSQIIGGPSWTGSQRYDVTAKVGSELATRPADELARLQPQLLQSLLNEI